MRALVLIPTYNELGNIGPIISAIRAEKVDTDILVIDDNSPDGTADKVREISKSDPGVHLLFRQHKQGLGRAYLAGFDWGLSKNYDVLVEMDADFSHRPQDLKKILAAMQTADFVIGSRYIPGGETVNWKLSRRIISRGGSFYSSVILGTFISDWTGGFNGWTAEVLRDLDLSTVESEGYAFQIELKYRAIKKGFKLIQVPIIFEDRRVGKSKMSSNIFMEAIHRVWRLRFQKVAPRRLTGGHPSRTVPGTAHERSHDSTAHKPGPR